MGGLKLFLTDNNGEAEIYLRKEGGSLLQGGSVWSESSYLADARCFEEKEIFNSIN